MQLAGQQLKYKHAEFKKKFNYSQEDWPCHVTEGLSQNIVLQFVVTSYVEEYFSAYIFHKLFYTISCDITYLNKVATKSNRFF